MRASKTNRANGFSAYAYNNHGAVRLSRLPLPALRIMTAPPDKPVAIEGFYVIQRWREANRARAVHDVCRARPRLAVSEPIPDFARLYGRANRHRHQPECPRAAYRHAAAEQLG